MYNEYGDTKTAGDRTGRKESNIGTLISLLVLVVLFAFASYADHQALMLGYIN